jgi:hypothetical protein
MGGAMRTARAAVGQHRARTLRPRTFPTPIDLPPVRCGDLRSEPDLHMYDAAERVGHIGPKAQGWGFRLHTRNAAGAEAREAAFQYELLLNDDWTAAVREAGKLPGWSSSGKPDGTLYAGNGGDNVHGNDGWTLRGGYHLPITAELDPDRGFMPIHTYGYYLSRIVEGRTLLLHEIQRRVGRNFRISYNQAKAVCGPGEYPDLVSNYGQKVKWDCRTPPGRVRIGEWTRIRQDMRVNDPGVPNGWLKAYVNDLLVGCIEGLMLRLDGPYRPPHSTLAIGSAWFNFYHGGMLRPRGEAAIRVREIAIQVREWDSVPLPQ